MTKLPTPVAAWAAYVTLVAAGVGVTLGAPTLPVLLTAAFIQSAVLCFHSHDLLHLPMPIALVVFSVAPLMSRVLGIELMPDEPHLMATLLKWGSYAVACEALILSTFFILSARHGRRWISDNQATTP